jgi:DNA-binding NarL/FixJ family response regulator
VGRPELGHLPAPRRTVIAVIGLLRARAQAPFSRAELLAARRIQPLIEHAYLCGISAESPPARDVLYGCGLTAREVAVAELVAKGAGNAQIASALPKVLLDRRVRR